MRSQAALERKRRRARDPERGARGAPGGRCPKNAQRCDESSFENPSGHRAAETTSAPPTHRRILTCSAIRASPGGGIVSAPGVLLLNNIIFWIQDGNYPAGFYVENNYPGGIITPTSIIPLVFYARDNYPEFFPTTLEEDFCLLGFQRKLSSRRSGTLSFSRNSLLGRPTSAATLRIGNRGLATH